MNIKAQVVPVHFPTDSAQWMNEHQGCPSVDCLSWEQFDTVFYYTMKGDTNISSTNYKILKMFYKWINYSNGTIHLSAENILGGIRYDAPSNKVYYYNSAAGSEQLAYKFNLSPGDHFVTHYTHGEYTDSLITRVTDSIINFTDYYGISSTKNVHYMYSDYCGWASSMFPAAIINNVGSLWISSKVVSH
jgi:hypothetical protein